MKDYTMMTAAEHRLELMGRGHLTVSGVEDVERFDETGIVMSTSAGTLVITGEDLHIETFQKNDGTTGHKLCCRAAGIKFASDGQGQQQSQQPRRQAQPVAHQAPQPQGGDSFDDDIPFDNPYRGSRALIV